MPYERLIDLGGRTAAELLEIQSIYEAVDDAYRQFRALLWHDCLDHETVPVEWIPIYDQ
jgi:hypothetical protein